MLKLLLILPILNCALATKKEEYVCSLQARVDGFVIKECFNWWDPNYPKWKIGKWGDRFVAVFVATPEEFSVIKRKIEILKVEWRDKLKQRSKAEKEKQAMSYEKFDKALDSFKESNFFRIHPQLKTFSGY